MIFKFYWKSSEICKIFVLWIKQYSVSIFYQIDRLNKETCYKSLHVLLKNEQISVSFKKILKFFDKILSEIEFSLDLCNNFSHIFDCAS